MAQNFCVPATERKLASNRSTVLTDQILHARGNLFIFQDFAAIDLRQTLFNLADEPLVVTHQTLHCLIHERLAVAPLLLKLSL